MQIDVDEEIQSSPHQKRQFITKTLLFKGKKKQTICLS